ncbi:MAG: amidohydrolase family protein [Acidobacteriota bacterium]
MNEQERYQQIDVPFYEKNVAPFLPDRVLDFHAHTWKSEHWKEVPWETGKEGTRYLVTTEQYGVETLLADGKRIFPDRDYLAVCFGYPTPAAHLEKENDYVAGAGERPGLFPLYLAGNGLTPIQEIEKTVRDRGFFGYKVFLNWYGDNYSHVRVRDMLGSDELKLADRLGLVVLLHVPAARRLADPLVQEGVKAWSEACPNARFVLAHCGRAYHPDEMSQAIGAIADLSNVYMDSSMVMEPQVLQMVLENIDSSRLLYATDFPVAAMRGRRVYVMDHWVDVVLEGYPPSAFRVAGDNIHATFMAWEIALAVKRAADMVKLPARRLRDIFFENGIKVLQHVMNGEQYQVAVTRWQAQAAS